MEAVAQAFEVPYTGKVQWQVEARAATTHTPVDFPDSALLAIVYTGAAASRNCFDELQVPVSVTLSTSQSSIGESGDATLTIWRSAQGLEARLSYEGTRVKVTANLPEPGTGAAPLVSIDALDPSLPGASASFSEEP